MTRLGRRPAAARPGANRSRRVRHHRTGPFEPRRDPGGEQGRGAGKLGGRPGLDHLVQGPERQAAAGRCRRWRHAERQRGACARPPVSRRPLAPEFGKRLRLLPSMRVPSFTFVVAVCSYFVLYRRRINPPQIAGARRTSAGLRGLAVLLLTPSQPERLGAAPRSRRHLPSGLRPPREGIPRHLNRKEKARRAGQSEGSDGNSPSFGGSDRFQTRRR